jgi:predicted phosphate transport protein (TIGR00153 family)
MRFWMPPFGMGKEKEILDNLLKIMNSVHKSVTALDGSIKLFAKEKYDEAEKMALKCSMHEQKADDDRRILERIMYIEGFLPFSREDYFNLAEAFDNIADQAEKASMWLTFKKIKIPAKIKPMIINLSEKTVETVEKLKEIVDNLGPKSVDLISEMEEVEDRRENVRDVIHTLGKEIFKEKNSTDAFMLWELVYRIMSVADRTEEASDRIMTITMKLVE